MTQYIESACKSYTAGGAIAKYLRVKRASGVLAAAGSTDQEIGTLEDAAFASGDVVPVRLRTAQGTCPMVASEPITVDDAVYAASGGKIAASGTVLIGIAQETASGDGSVIEVLRRQETSDSAAAGGTTAAAFEVDSDSSTPKIRLAGQSGGTGDFTTTLVPESTLSADNEITVPEADGDTLVAVALAQTLTNKTFTSPVLTGLSKMGQTVTPVAAAGSTVADAGQLPSTNFAHITSDGAAKGVKLPTTAASHWGIVINNSATAAEFYAASGGTVNGGSADASVVIAASKGILWFATGADTIIAFDLPALATAS